MGPGPRTPGRGTSCTPAGASSPEHPHASEAVHTHTMGPEGAPSSLQLERH